MLKIEHKYKYDEIVIGNNCDSALYAYDARIPLISTLTVPPLPHETIDNDVVEEFDLPDNSKKGLWELLRFRLSLAGLMPFSNKVSSVSIEDGLAKIATKNDKLIKVLYDKIYIFDDDNVVGIEDRLKVKADTYKVLDWFDVKSGAKHNYDFLQGDSDFVKEIHFFDSQRVEGNHGLKDLVAVSYLNTEQLNSFDCSSLHSRYHVVNIMMEAGIKGKRNGRDPNDKTKFKFRSIKLELNKREIRSFEKSEYESDSEIVFC